MKAIAALLLATLTLLFPTQALPIYDSPRPPLIENLDTETTGDPALWRKRCLQKKPKDCYLLGLSYLESYKVMYDSDFGKRLLLGSCRQGFLAACVALEEAVYGNRDIFDMTHYGVKRIDAFKSGCELGHVASCSNIAELMSLKIMLDALDSPPSYPGATKFSYEGNNSGAAYRNIDEEVSLARADVDEALMVISDAAVRDRAMGVMISFCEWRNGKYCSFLRRKNILTYDSSKHITKMVAACKKHGVSCGLVARAYDRGLGVSTDKERAAFYFKLGCDKDREFCYEKVLGPILED